MSESGYLGIDISLDCCRIGTARLISACCGSDEIKGGHNDLSLVSVRPTAAKYERKPGYRLDSAFIPKSLGGSPESEPPDVKRQEHHVSIDAL
jgi:hypothetical protein